MPTFEPLGVDWAWGVDGFVSEVHVLLLWRMTAISIASMKREMTRKEANFGTT